MKRVITLLICMVFAFSATSCDLLDLLDLSEFQTTSKVIFNGVDRKGNFITEDIFSQYDVTMINFREPWCRPCVSEMPAIEMLYENYSAKGLLVIGVYSDDSMEDQVDAILFNSHTSYPIMKKVEFLDQYRTGSVPTTIFVDKEGNLMDVSFVQGCQDRVHIVGSREYGDWASIVNRLLPSKTGG